MFRVPGLRLPALAATSLLVLGLAGCGSGDDTTSTAAPASTTTSSAATSPAATTAEKPAASTTTAATSTTSAGTGVLTAASSLAKAFSADDFGAVYEQACPGIRKGKTKQAYVASLSDAPHVGLSAPVVVSPEAAGSDAELPAPGVTVDKTSYVKFTVASGSEAANPTTTARFVHSDAGWQYCGMLPDA